MFENNNVSNPAVTGVAPTFFGKVMFFFALAIMSSALGVYTTMNYFMSYFIEIPWLMYGLFALELIIILTSRLWRTHSPLNRILFVAFTFITGVTVAPLIAIVSASATGPTVLMQALLATGLMFTATALIGWTTKYDLSRLGGFLMMGLIGMIIVGIIGIFLPWGSTTEMVYSGIGVLIFCGYTMYDFQKIKRYPEDAYIDAALALYLDIFNLFLFILRLMNRR